MVHVIFLMLQEPCSGVPGFWLLLKDLLYDLILLFRNVAVLLHDFLEEVLQRTLLLFVSVQVHELEVAAFGFAVWTLAKSISLTCAVCLLLAHIEFDLRYIFQALVVDVLGLGKDRVISQAASVALQDLHLLVILFDQDLVDLLLPLV